MFRVLAYIGNTIHNDETVECVEYIFEDPIKMNNYLVYANNIMRDKEQYFSYVVEEVKIEKDLTEMDKHDKIDKNKEK